MVFINCYSKWYILFGYLVNDMIFLQYKFIINFNKRSDWPYCIPILGGRDTKKVKKQCGRVLCGDV